MPNFEGTAVPETMTLKNTQSLSPEDVEVFVTEAKAGVGGGPFHRISVRVLFLILGINVIPKFFGFDVEEEKKNISPKRPSISRTTKSWPLPPCRKCPWISWDFPWLRSWGYVLGSIKIFMGPLGMFSLGSTGGAILVSLGLGSLGKVGPVNFRMNSTVLGKMRTYFLSVFLAGTGLNYGYRVIDAITGAGYMIVIISSLVAILSVLFGFLLGRYAFHINWTLLSGAITGGMTSARAWALP